MLRTATKVDEFAASIIILVVFTSTILIVNKDGHAQSREFGLVLQAIETVSGATDQVISGIDTFLATNDALGIDPSKSDQFSKSQFGVSLAHQLHALDHVRVPGPPELSELAVSYGDIADPATRCQSYRKLQQGADTLKEWHRAIEEVITKAGTLQYKLSEADKSRRKLATGTEWCALNIVCGNVFTSVMDQSELANDISNAQSVVKQLISTAEKDKKQYSEDVKKKQGQYQDAVKWVSSSVTDIDGICQREEDMYSKREESDDALKKYLDVQDISAQDQQVSDYLNRLPAQMAEVGDGINKGLKDIEDWKQKELAKANAAAVAAMAAFNAAMQASSHLNAGGQGTDSRCQVALAELNQDKLLLSKGHKYATANGAVIALEPRVQQVQGWYNQNCR